MIRELNIEELLEVLHNLDIELEGYCIEIRAVGGFALAWRKIREEGVTADIDTLTDDYPKEVQDIITKIGKKHSLEPWWLNNDVAADDAELIIATLNLTWELVDEGFSNIKLYIADSNSLLALKLVALEDSQLSGRAHDLDDIIRILLSMGYSKETFKKKFSHLQESQPYAYKLLCRAAW